MFLAIIIALATYTSMMVSDKYRNEITIVGTGIMLLYCVISKIFAGAMLFQKVPAKIVILIFAPCSIYLIGLSIYSLFKYIHSKDNKDIKTNSNINEITDEMMKPAPPPIPPHLLHPPIPPHLIDPLAPPPHLPHPPVPPPKPMPHTIIKSPDKNDGTSIESKESTKDMETTITIDEGGDDL